MERHLNLRKLRVGRAHEVYKKISYPTIPTTSSDLYVITQIGDRLDSLAYQFYQDNDLWWIISIANPNIIRTKPAWYIIIGWLSLVLVLDIIPFFLIEPEINLESILFTIILILVYLLICQNNSIKMEGQYFTKGKKFNEASNNYILFSGAYEAT